MPMFNPVNSDLLVYGEVDETIGVGPANGP